MSAADETTIGQTYSGPVAFDGAAGFHYPVIVNDDGTESGPDRTRPLSWTGDHYEFCGPEEATHLHKYQKQVIELEVK